MMMEIIQASWLDFSKALPKDDPEHVRKERRRSFFAGAMAVMHVLTTAAADATDEEGVAILKILARELEFNGEAVGTPEEDRRVY